MFIRSVSRLLNCVHLADLYEVPTRCWVHPLESIPISPVGSSLVPLPDILVLLDLSEKISHRLQVSHLDRLHLCSPFCELIVPSS